MTALRIAFLAAVLLLSACGGDERAQVDAGQRSQTPISDADGAVIKGDHYGNIALPDGVKITSLTHEDPYVWQAELEFTRPTLEVLVEIAKNLETIRFDYPERWKATPAAMCEPALAADGSGNCETLMELPAGGGYIVLRVTRPSPRDPARVTAIRRFEHRMPDDRIGPPYPKKR